MPGQIIWVLVEKSFGLGLINYEIVHLYSCHVLNSRVLLLESVERSRRAKTKPLERLRILMQKDFYQ